MPFFLGALRFAVAIGTMERTPVRLRWIWTTIRRTRTRTLGSVALAYAVRLGRNI